MKEIVFIAIQCLRIELVIACLSSFRLYSQIKDIILAGFLCCLHRSQAPWRTDDGFFEKQSYQIKLNQNNTFCSGIINLLFEHILIRACEQCVYFWEHEHLIIFLASSEHFRNYRWRAASTLEKYRWRAASTSSTSSYFVNFPLAGISLSLIGHVVLRQVIVNNHAETSKSEQ